jgi:hypothetical protein
LRRGLPFRVRSDGNDEERDEIRRTSDVRTVVGADDRQCQHTTAIASRMHTIARVAAVVAATLVVQAGTACAAQYPGWADTGWVYASKRECCRAAIEGAAQYSAQACLVAGGVPRSFAGASQRGTCSAEWTQHDGELFYRCSGEASVWCR